MPLFEDASSLRIDTAAALTRDGVPVGMPLEWPVVDRDGTLLFERAAILASDDEHEFLFEHFAPHRGDLLADNDRAAVHTPRPPSSSAPAGLFDMHLPVGASMGLRPQTVANAPMHRCRLIGFSPDEAIFVTLPYPDGYTKPLRAGEPVEVVAVASQAVFRFHCTVDAVRRAPVAYLVLSRPGAIRCLRLRRSVRVNARIAVRYGLGKSGNGYSGIALAHEISVPGLSLSAAQPLGAVGDRLHIAFRLRSTELDTPIETAAIIRNVHNPIDGGPAVIHGLELNRLSHAERTAMKAYVFDLQNDVAYSSDALK